MQGGQARPWEEASPCGGRAAGRDVLRQGDAPGGRVDWLGRGLWEEGRHLRVMCAAGFGGHCCGIKGGDPGLVSSTLSTRRGLKLGALPGVEWLEVRGSMEEGLMATSPRP